MAQSDTPRPGDAATDQVPLDPGDPDVCHADEPGGRDGLLVRRTLLERELVSPDLHNAIHAVLRSVRRGGGWADLVAEVDEVLSEVARRALARADGFDPGRSRPLAWLMGIAVNVVREWRRFAARDRRHLVPQAALSEEAWRQALDSLGGEPPPDPGAAEAVRRALAGLGDEQRRVLTLRYVQGLSGPELAGVLGVTPAAARARIYRALQALRREFRS